MAASTAFRLFAGTVAVFLVIAGLLVAVVFWQTNAVLTSQVMATLRSEADSISAEANTDGPAAMTAAVAARSRPEGPGLYYLADAAGTKLAGNLSRTPPEIGEGAAGGVFHYRPTLSPTERDHLAVAMSLPAPGGGTLVVGRDITDQRRFADGLKRVFIMSLAALTLAGLITALVLSRFVLARIEAINTASREIMAGDLSRRIPRNGTGDELDGLARNLNAMLDRIEVLLAGLKEVSENIAHDLKTPLSRLRNRMEAALRLPDGTPGQNEALTRSIEDADELIKAFNALLLIARLEANSLEKSSAPVDCGSLVRDVAEFYAPVAEEQGLALSIDTAPTPPVPANRELISQAVANLIENAMKYAPACEQSIAAPSITVTVRAGPEATRIEVADHGPGIPAADRERVFKRFVRLDRSRTAPGTGLGLSLVAAVARLHGGRVELEDNAPGLKVRLVLPAASGAAADTPENRLVSSPEIALAARPG